MTDITPPEPPAAARDWLVLLRAPGLGGATIRRLLELGLAPGDLLHASPDPRIRAELRPQSLDYLRDPDPDRLAADLAWLDADDHHLVTLADPAYPRLLREIPDPPPALFVVGEPALLAECQLAMVGSRNPTAGGARTAREFAAHLAATGLAITSGLATGIDAACHRGALDAGGTTIAVLGTGADRVYPAANRELAHAIAAQGALVSEFPPGTPPRAAHFPRRNRIISGLSLGTLVVEAAPRSGSLITARLAMEQGREVFAIPGSIHNPLARGCHGLIRQGAKLVETANDVLEELGALAGASLSGLTPVPVPPVDDPAELDADYSQLLDLMGYDPVSVDELVEASGLTPEAVSSMLLILELQGYVAAGQGGRYNRIRFEDSK